MMQICVYIVVPEGAQSDIGPHITLVFSPAATGDVADIQAAVVDALALLPETTSPTGEVELFGPDKDVPVALLPAGDFAPARDKLLARLTEMGCSAPATWPDFRPHITLKPDQPAPAGPIAITTVRLVVDGEQAGEWSTWGRQESPPPRRRLRARRGRAPLRLSVTAAPGTFVTHGERLDARLSALPSPAEHRPAPDGFIVGQPMVIARVGSVYDRRTGELRARFTAADLGEAVEYFNRTGVKVPVDREHAEREPGGQVLAMWLVDGGQAVAALPAYNAQRPTQTCAACAAGDCRRSEHEPLATYVDRLKGTLWPSPRVTWQGAHDATTGERIGRCWFPNIALTTEPATAHHQVSEVRLSSTAELAEPPTPSPEDAQEQREEVDVIDFDALREAARGAGLPPEVADEAVAKLDKMEAEGLDVASATKTLLAMIGEAVTAARLADGADAGGDGAEAGAGDEEGGDEERMMARVEERVEERLSARMAKTIEEREAAFQRRISARLGLAEPTGEFPFYGMPVDDAFGHSVRLSAVPASEREMFGLVHAMGAERGKAYLEKLGWVPGALQTDVRLSSPGERPTRTGDPQVLDELAALEGPALAKRLEELDRANDPRLAQID